MRAIAETKQPITVELTREEAREMVKEIYGLITVGGEVNLLYTLKDHLEQAECLFKSEEYQGPG